MSDTDPYAAPEGPNVEEAKVEATEAPEESPKAAEQPVEDVPAGSIKDVLAWVGTDVERAHKALDAEKASDESRSSLITKLEAIVN